MVNGSSLQPDVCCRQRQSLIGSFPLLIFESTDAGGEGLVCLRGVRGDLMSTADHCREQKQGFKRGGLEVSLLLITTRSTSTWPRRQTVNQRRSA